MIYSDTSFLFAIYQSRDAFHVPAKKLMARNLDAIAFTLLGEFELLNNVHRALASGTIGRAEHDAILRQVETDETDGILVRQAIYDADLYARARAISKKFSVETNSRSLDVLHVAAAELLCVTSFVSFDIKQRLLAQKVGLGLLPRALGRR
jgi:predicted nucleic acid-binding protein